MRMHVRPYVLYHCVRVVAFTNMVLPVAAVYSITAKQISVGYYFLMFRFVSPTFSHMFSFNEWFGFVHHLNVCVFFLSVHAGVHMSLKLFCPSLFHSRSMFFFLGQSVKRNQQVTDC